MGRLLGTAGVAVLTGLLAAPVHAGMPNDDLSVVRRATHARNVDAARPAVSRAATPASRPAPHWLKVRVVEDGETTLTLNLPLGLVRALGDRAPTGWACGGDARSEGRRACSRRLLSALATLEPGQDLVLVRDASKTVRVWLE